MPSTQADIEESVNIQIDKNYFGNWTDVEIDLGIDSFATVTMVAPFERSRREFRDLFRPFQFRDLEVDTHLETLFHGYLIGVPPKLDASSSSVTCTGYAKPGVFADSNMPASELPLEFKKLGLKAIAERCCKPFGLEVDFQGPEGKPFDKVRITHEKKVFEFLADLAKQRSLVISNTVEGKLLFWQSVEPGNPVARFIQGQQPFTTVEPAFNEREYYSEITGFAAKKRGKSPAKWTEKNPWLTTPLRACTFKLEDTERGDAPEATKARLGRMFANMVTYTIPDLPGWRDPHGKVWQPNTTVTLMAPDAMVYRETELLIKLVKLKTTKDVTSASLDLVLPGAFNGKVPEFLPWLE